MSCSLTHLGLADPAGPILASSHCSQALLCSKWWLAAPGRPYASCCFDCLSTLEVIKALKGKVTALITLNVNTVAFTLGLESLLMNWIADEPFSFLSHGLFFYKMRLRSVWLHENIVGITEQYQTLKIYYQSFIFMLNATSFFRIFLEKTRTHPQMYIERLLSDKHKLDYKNMKI